MRKTLVTYFFLLLTGILAGQETENIRTIGNNYYEPISSFPYDTLLNKAESVPEELKNTTDTVKADTVHSTATLAAPVVYSALDSMIVSADGQKAYLYNNAKLTYQSIELNAYYIEFDLETKEVFAKGLEDSTGTLIGKPKFQDGNEEFESKTMRYNFITGKGITTDVKSAQGEGFVHSDWTKKISDKEYIMKTGKYTTCDADHPHFYLHLTKAKVISNEKIITGPAYMVLEDFPLYFPILPFGYFPSTQTYSSGILMPGYGEEQNRGFYLQDGGYYWAASEYFDASVRGDIYSKGSWGVKFHTNYKLRYRFNGNFDLKYAKNFRGEKGTDSFSESNQFQIIWSHSQDAKANPSRNFSANVNFSTSGYDKDNARSAQNYLTTQKSSSISFSKRWENSPFSMSANLRHSQNSRDSTLTLSLPDMTFTMSKIYPLKRKVKVGGTKWYEKFGFSYTGSIKNSITAKESEILDKSLIDDWKNGIQHKIPISLPNFNVLNYVNVSPSFSYSEKWYFRTLQKEYDPISKEIIESQVGGFRRNYEYSYSLGTSTNIYGNFTPLNTESRIKGIRHKMSPSISFSYSPDFGDSKYGFWKTVQDSTGQVQYYDSFQGGVFGASPGRGASGAISFSMSNNLEMKMLDLKDTSKTEDAETKYKKVKIIDNLSLSTSYNLIADSLNMSPIIINGRTTVKGISVNFGTTLDPYMTVPDTASSGAINAIRVHEYVWNNKNGIGKLGRLTRAFMSFGMSFKSKKGEKEAEENKEEIEDRNTLAGDYVNYQDFNVPWDFRFDYSFNYSRPNPYRKATITQTLSLSGSANLTEKWRISGNTNFDIMAQEFSYTSFNLTRDLHCWQMSLNFVPFGYRRSYSFTISANSGMLRDLKIMKNKSFYDNF